MSRLAPVTGWFLSRTPRERWLIGLMLAIAIPLVAWVAVARPMLLSLEAAKARHVAAVRAHGAVLAQLAQLETSPPGAVPSAESGAPLALRVTDAAARAGLRLTANEPRGPDAVSIAVSGPPTASLRWLRQLEAGGLSVRELTITPEGPNAVIVRATLGTGVSS
jgi:general secretion pathway protein M